MSLREVPLEISSEGIKLACSISIPERPRGVVVLLHGIPTVQPPAQVEIIEGAGHRLRSDERASPILGSWLERTLS